jgi:2-iminobutanoate/2-iminopropanoate deaminase
LTNVADRQKINPIRQRYFGQHRPASTLVEVSALVLPALRVEIEAQAVLP